jgi:RNase H-fold protein (predicted Holliday junction resolvase)
MAAELIQWPFFILSNKLKRRFVFGLTGIILLAFILWCQNKSKSPATALKSSFPSGDKDYYQADSLTGHFHKPNVTRDFKWPEHPLGKVIMKTNNLGFRSDATTEIEKAEGTIRIIITGDSHTDGVIYNSESVASRLEEMLREKYPEKKFEALNAGNGYFGPQNYFGVYRKFLSLKPDVFTVIIYTGNDFLDGIRIETENDRLSVPARSDNYYEDLWKVDKLYSGFTGQFLNQVKFFKSYPQFTETAMKIMKDNLEKIDIICKKNNTRFLIVLLPSKIDTEAQTDSTRISEVFRIMNYDQQDVIENKKMTENLSALLAEKQIPFVDLFSSFKSSEKELFWKADYHVNHLGHEEMAKQIMMAGFFNNSQ